MAGWSRGERILLAGAVATIAAVFAARALEAADVPARLDGAWEAARAALRGPPGSASFTEVLLPTILAFGVAALVVELAPPRRAWARALVVGAMTFLGARYIAWRLVATLNLHDPASATLSIVFFAADLFIFACGTVNLLALVAVSDRRAEADRLERELKDGARPRPTVDIFVPTYNEPVAMLRRSIVGCQAIEYEPKRVWLLDDRRRPEMRALAAELGCDYLDREDNRHAKAGNLNRALERTEGELVASFDADFIPARNFLDRTVGFFADPSVVLVQTPQAFYNADPIQRNLGLEDTLLEEQAPFFLSVEDARDRVDAVICTGSSFLVRRSALVAAGGVPTESATEDHATSIALAARGGRLLHLNECLSVGLAAESIGAYMDQRLRWAQGTVQLLFSKQNPLAARGLRLSHRLLFLFGSLFVFAMCFPRILLLLLPLAYLLFAIAPIQADLASLAYYLLPYSVFGALVAAWLNGGTRSAAWTPVYATIMCFSQAWRMLATFVRPFGKGRGFSVTPKGFDVRGVRFDRRVAAPLCAVAALIAGALAWRAATGPPATAEPVEVGGIYFFALLNLLYLWIAIQACFDVPQQRGAIRRRCALECTVGARGRAFEGRVVDLSEAGARVALAGPFPTATAVTVALPEIGVEVRARVRRTGGGARRAWVALAFEDVPLATRRKLVEYLFCRPGTWGGERMEEGRSVWALLRSLVRIFPLAEAR